MRFIFAAALVMVGCTSVPGFMAPVPLSTPFDPVAVAFAKGSGDAAIEGQAFLKTRGGEVRYGAGETVTLIPASPYTEEYMQGVGTTRGAAQADPRLAELTRTTTSGGDGKFVFRNVPTGNYFVYTKVFWEVPGQYGMTTSGSWVKGTITLKAGETTNVVLTEK